MSDASIDALRQHRIPTAVLSDTLDAMELRNQAMRAHIRLASS